MMTKPFNSDVWKRGEIAFALDEYDNENFLDEFIDVTRNLDVVEEAVVDCVMGELVVRALPKKGNFINDVVKAMRNSEKLKKLLYAEMVKDGSLNRLGKSPEEFYNGAFGLCGH